MKIARVWMDGKKHTGYLENERFYPFVYSDICCKEVASQSYSTQEVKLLAPCTPSKIVCVGLNYKEHAKELNFETLSQPQIFLKPPSAVIGPMDEIVYPDSSGRVDYEAELAVVMGKKAKNLSAEQVPEAILGYTCLNDVTARDIQNTETQWTRAKGFDTFCPIGPCIETKLSPQALDIKAILNGKTVQHGNTSDMIFSVYQLVAFISQVMTLLPGDVIATGTPSGIGPMARGDTIEIAIEGIGNLVNQVK